MSKNKLEIPKELKSSLEIGYFKLFTHWVEIGILEEFFICEQFPKEMHFVLFEGLKEKTPIQLKTKVIYKEKTTIRPHIYTPDFKLVFTENSFRLLEKYLSCYTVHITKDHKFIVWVENKPVYDKNNMLRLYRTTAKWMFSIYGFMPQLWNEKDLKVLKELKL